MGWKVKFSVIPLVLLLAVSCGGMETMRIGTEGAYPPFNYLNDAGELEGFDIEVGEELCRLVQLKCQWVINDWQTIIHNLQDSKYDAIVAGMSITPQREEVIDFTQPYYPPEPSMYVAMAGSGAEATRGRVAVQSATVHADYLDGKVTESLEYPLVEDAIEAVLSGEADSAFATFSYLRKVAAVGDGRLAYIGGETLIGSGTGIGIREEDGPLKEKLDHAISEMKEDGSLNELIRKWLGPDARTF